MRIKKVEISAFRAYNDSINSTFDFTIPNDDIADFVSIYAPNGYGKTSFYDAVEWCITGQIERFHRNNKEYEKLGIENRKANKDNPFFLQHNNRKDILGSVNIETNIKSFSRKLTSSKVYDFSKKASEVYFKDVILSQDLIDTFIKEDKAEDRYNKFIENISSLEKYNHALKNIIKLKDNASEKLKAFIVQKNEIEEIQLKLDFEGDQRILEEINQIISNLIKSKEDLILIKKDNFSKNEFDVLTQKVSSRILSLEMEIISLEESIKMINKSFNGSESESNILGVSEYQTLIKKNEELSDKIEELNKVLSHLNEVQTLKKLIEDRTKEVDRMVNVNNNHLKHKIDFPKFLEVDKEIQMLNEESIDLNSQLSKNKKSLDKVLESENNLGVDISKLKQELKFQKEIIEELPNNSIKLLDVTESKRKIINDIKKTNEEIEKVAKSDEQLDSQRKEFIYYKDKLNSDIEILLDYDLFKQYENLFKEVLFRQRFIKTLEKDLFKVDEKIKEQEKLNDELNIFISKGLELTTKNKSSTCILCSNEYNSFQELLDRISGNKLLDELLMNSLKEKSLIKSKISLNKGEILEKLKSVDFFIKEKIDDVEDRKSKKTIELEKLNKTLSKHKQKLSILSEEENTLLLFFRNKSVDEFESFIKNEIDVIQSEIKKKDIQLEKVKLDIKELIAINEKLLNSITLLNKKINKSRNKNIYTKTLKYFNDILKTNSTEISFIENEIQKNKKIIFDLKLEIEQYEKDINTKNKNLINNELSKEELSQELNLVKKSKLSYEKEIQNFEQFILTEFEIKLKGVSSSTIQKKFEELIKKEKKDLAFKQEVYKNYKLVEALKDNTYNFLVSENTKKDLIKINRKIQTFSKISLMLIDEKENLESFLKKTIDSFFHTKLINKLYQKIDPHPDYNQVEFDCNFTDKRPRLQIYIIDKNGNKSIPSLYFSTAQVNVLSLSIFLARALKVRKTENGKTVRCIFIDDPIQSMDSINILSFIDLFRSIIVNLNRQLIVSSHEESFYLLLQKKIPRDLFKSKFISFDTFGKLNRG
ncbi:AAA family ATPase [Dokdonia ponticola]|uniref:AAA family ATPase n=1 Tax=Dokdonia ponticola TaxID=2041041 RepID=A0ABV9HVR6_9FLAO